VEDYGQDDRRADVKQYRVKRISGKVSDSGNNLFQISDDDRMSLTTAVSDEDDPEGPEGDSVHNSPYRAKQMRGDSAASFNCTGAVRKAG